MSNDLRAHSANCFRHRLKTVQATANQQYTSHPAKLDRLKRRCILSGSGAAGKHFTGIGDTFGRK